MKRRFFAVLVCVGLLAGCAGLPVGGGGDPDAQYRFSGNLIALGLARHDPGIVAGAKNFCAEFGAEATAEGILRAAVSYLAKDQGAHPEMAVLIRNGLSAVGLGGDVIDHLVAAEGGAAWEMPVITEEMARRVAVMKAGFCEILCL